MHSQQQPVEQPLLVPMLTCWIAVDFLTAKSPSLCGCGGLRNFRCDEAQSSRPADGIGMLIASSKVRLAAGLNMRAGDRQAQEKNWDRLERN